MTQSFRSKLKFCTLGLFLPGTGFNCFYLQGMKSFWAWMQLLSLLGGAMGYWLLQQNTSSSGAAWFLLILGFIAIEASWLTTIAFGLRPDEKWDAQFNTEAKDNQKTESGWPVVISVILSLILGAGVMMIFLAIGFEQFFMYQIEEARKISQ
ncbi:MAG: hypothetical protein RJA82_226 [Pseudomonadota bacterium]|jgi:hypothetical protein|nr:hypothetical protein [Burkholderiaceae bacterium]NDF20426.1 hypothetical protein [Burkholderiaceae bacterium]